MEIYINIVLKCIKNTLNEKGYLLFVTPKQSLRILLGENLQQQQIDKLYNILFLNTSDDIKSKYFSNVGSDFMYFLVQNDDYHGNTHLIDDTNKETDIKLEFNSFLSTNTNTSNTILNKVLKTDKGKSLWRKASRIDCMSEKDIKRNDIKDKEDSEHKNKLIVFLRTNPENDLVKWTSKTHDDTNKYKVFYPSLGERYVIDKERNLMAGTTSVLYIPCNSLNECNNIVKLGYSKLFKYLKKSFSGKNPIDSVWNNLIKPSSFDIEIKSDADIYKYFNLTKDDIKMIENNTETKVLQQITPRPKSSKSSTPKSSHSSTKKKISSPKPQVTKKLVKLKIKSKNSSKKFGGKNTKKHNRINLPKKTRRKLIKK